MLTAQQTAIEANPDHEFCDLNINAGGMWARRIIQRIIEAECRHVASVDALAESR